MTVLYQYRKFLLQVIVLLIAGIHVRSQDLQEIKQAFSAISKNYDSKKELSFDIIISVNTLAKGEKPLTDRVTGSYILSGNKALYKLGDTESMINDSILVSVSNEDKLIITGEPKQGSYAAFFPFRETMDSLLRLSSERYTVTMTRDKKAGTALISFLAKNENEQISSFLLSYNEKDLLIRSLQYDSKEYKDPVDYSVSDKQVLVNKTMRIDFSAYKTESAPANIFMEENYIVVRNGEKQPAEKYTGYQLYDSNPRQTK